MNEELKQLIDERIKNYFTENSAPTQAVVRNTKDLSDRTINEKHIQLLDARHIQLGKTNGTKIGTQTTQKLAFWNATPIVQPAAISAPSGGATIDSQARTAITSLIAALKNIGLTA
jgi:hypothetical protein